MKQSALPKAIYEPRGPALEYAPLACNLFNGCAHGCEYCYVPNCLRMSRESWNAAVSVRAGILEALSKDLRSSDRAKRLLFCFTSDPYQPDPALRATTRAALRLCRDSGQPFTVLSKGGLLAANDFDCYFSGETCLGTFATTLTVNDNWERWEPRAASPESRIESLREAKRQGIPIWVSLEPVIDPRAALNYIDVLGNIVDAWKIGKLNYHPHSKCIDWKTFGAELATALENCDKPYLVKKSLRRYMPPEFPTNTLLDWDNLEHFSATYLY